MRDEYIKRLKLIIKLFTKYELLSGKAEVQKHANSKKPKALFKVGKTF